MPRHLLLPALIALLTTVGITSARADEAPRAAPARDGHLTGFVEQQRLRLQSHTRSFGTHEVTRFHGHLGERTISGHAIHSATRPGAHHAAGQLRLENQRIQFHGADQPSAAGRKDTRLTLAGDVLGQLRIIREQPTTPGRAAEGTLTVDRRGRGQVALDLTGRPARGDATLRTQPVPPGAESHLGPRHFAGREGARSHLGPTMNFLTPEAGGERTPARPRADYFVREDRSRSVFSAPDFPARNSFIGSDRPSTGRTSSPFATSRDNLGRSAGRSATNAGRR